MPPNLYMLWLSALPGLSASQKIFLLERFGGAEAVYRAEYSEYLAAADFSAEQLSRLTDKNVDGVRASLDEMARVGVKALCLSDEDYPALLKTIADPPLVLYLLGNLPDGGLPRVSIIGSRKYSEYGILVTRKFAKELAARRVVVVSGMARGLDSVAAKAALEAGGQTIAVLGSGLDVCYPPENRGLMEAIAKQGAVISEYPLGTKPLSHHFPARNRIISGLSAATLITEAGARSGTMITADLALEQGREVFAVPSAITNRWGQGGNLLIKQGAAVATEAGDLLDALGLSGEETVPAADTEALKAAADLSPEEKVVYDSIGSEPIGIDTLIQRANAMPQTISYLLTRLELKKLIKKLPGERYIREI